MAAKKKAKSPACRCIQEVDTLLATRGHRLITTFGSHTRTVVRTEKLDDGKRWPKQFLTANFCPFCGKRYPA